MAASISLTRRALSVGRTIKPSPPALSFSTKPPRKPRKEEEEDEFGVPTSGISRPLSDTLRELNKRVPDSFVKMRRENDFQLKYIPWHIVNRIMNVHAQEWSGEVRNITYSPDGKTVSVVYRVTIYGTDAEEACIADIRKDCVPQIFRESTGTAAVDDTRLGDAVQTAEAMAFRRACARFGLGLHLYHEDLL